MRIQPCPLRWWVLPGILGIIVSLLTACNPTPAASDTAVCPEGWWEHPSEAERERCAALAATDTARTIRVAAATAQHLLTLSPLPTITPDPRPAMPAPTVTIPEGLRQVAELDRVEFVDGPPLLRGSSSIWQLGAVVTANGRDFSTLLLLARPPQDGSFAWMDILPDDFSNADLYQRYHRVWMAETDIGQITITQVDNVSITPNGIAGTVAFTTTTGFAGTLDLQQDFVTDPTAPPLPTATLATEIYSANDTCPAWSP